MVGCLGLLTLTVGGTYQFTLWCRQQVVHRRARKHFVGHQKKSSCFALTSHDSLLLFIFFHFEVYMIEKEYSVKREISLSLSLSLFISAIKKKLSNKYAT